LHPQPANNRLRHRLAPGNVLAAMLSLTALQPGRRIAAGLTHLNHLSQAVTAKWQGESDKHV
ncbi:hypothetical protein, partial [Pantoea ananatis]